MTEQPGSSSQANTDPQAHTDPEATDTRPSSFDPQWLLQGLLRSTAAQVVTTAATFFSSIIIARETGAEGKGVIALLLASLALPIVILNAGVGRAAQVHLVRKRAKSRVVASVVVGYCVAAGTLAAMLLVLLREPIALLFLGGGNQHLVTLIAPLLPATLLIHSLGPILVAADRLKTRNRYHVAHSLLNLILLLAFMVLGDVTVAVVVAVSTGTGILIALGMTERIIRIYGWSFAWEKQIIRDLFGFGLRHQPAHIITVLSKRLEYFILAGFLGVRSVGIYSVAAATIDLVLLVPRTVMELGVPVFAAGGDRHSAHLAARLMRVGWAGALMLTAPLFLAGAILIPLVYGPEFERSVPLFGILLATFVLFPVGPIALQYLVARGQAHPVTTVYVAGAVINLAATGLLVAAIGLPGNAIASVVYYASLAGGAMMLLRARLSGSLTHELTPRRGDFFDVLGLLRRRGPG